MKCPICNVDLLMMDKQGVEIDYCPKCRGVWLDRGELEKLVAKLSPQPGERVDDDERKYERRSDDEDHKYDRKDDEYTKSYGYGGKQPKKKSKLSFLTDLLEGGGD